MDRARLLRRINWNRLSGSKRQLALGGMRHVIVALLAFYVCRYGFDNPVLATYAVFAVIAAAAFVQLPGPVRRQSLVLLMALPAAWALVALGTALASSTWAAAGGMLVIGFGITFFGVGGPRLVGLAGALQIFYIVASFPPFQPDALPSRLIGVTVGIALSAAAEVLLWPGPGPVTFQRRLQLAANALADLLEKTAEVAVGRASADTALAYGRDAVDRPIEETRVQALPLRQRPASAARRDRALRDGASVIREIGEFVRRLTVALSRADGHHEDVARVLRECAATVRSAGDTFTGSVPPVEPRQVAPVDFPVRPPLVGVPRPPPIGELRARSILLSTVEHIRLFATAARLAVGRTTGLEGQPAGAMDAFWYARRNNITLLWLQLKAHLSLGSVYFQGALRLAVALAAARVVAGELNLSHGFWVLLATLTIMRSSAITTRSTLFEASAGTLIGAIVTGLLLRFTHGAAVYAVELPAATVLALSICRLIGLMWEQAALTLMITLLFSLLAPSGWSLAGVRSLDVFVGGVIGIVTGLLIWPRGGGGELRRNVSSHLRVGADLIEKTVDALINGAEPGDALRGARRQLFLAEASLCQYYLERPDPRIAQLHWEAALTTAHHIVHGAESVLQRNERGCLASCADAARALTDDARLLRRGYRDLAQQIMHGRLEHRVGAPGLLPNRVVAAVIETGTRDQIRCAIELEKWLSDLSGNLTWIQTVSSRHPGER